MILKDCTKQNTIYSIQRKYIKISWFIEEIQYAGKTSLLRIFSAGKIEGLFFMSCLSTLK